MSRTIVVTGAANGIGKAVTEQLRAAGDTVIGIDLRGSDIDADLGTAVGRQQAIDAVTDRTDTLDALVLCAGVSTTNAAMISINYFGVTEIAEGLRPLLAATGEGRVVITSSAAGTVLPVNEEVVAACLTGDEAAALAVVEKLPPQQHLYGTSKRAVSLWVRRTCLAPGWADANICLNAIGPGVVETNMTAPLLADEQMRQQVQASTPMALRGHLKPEQVAKLLVWLVSEDNTHITGQVIHIDGGTDVIMRGADVFTGMEGSLG